MKSFSEWLSMVEQELASEVRADAWRGYFDQGLTPAEAVLQSRLDDELF